MRGAEVTRPGPLPAGLGSLEWLERGWLEQLKQRLSVVLYDRVRAAAVVKVVRI